MLKRNFSTCQPGQSSLENKFVWIFDFSNLPLQNFLLFLRQINFAFVSVQGDVNFRNPFSVKTINCTYGVRTYKPEKLFGRRPSETLRWF